MAQRPGFMQHVGGLLGGGNPIFDTGLGLLSASGPSTAPVSFGQALGQGAQFASSRQQQKMQNDFLRAKLSQQKSQQEAQAKLAGLLAPDPTAGMGPPPPPEMQAQRAQNQQQEMMGLLSQAAPEQFAQGMLGQIFPQGERSEPSLVRNIRALEDPTLTAEQRQLLKDNIASSDGATDELLQRVQLQLNSLKLQQAMQEQADAKRTALQQRMTAETSTRRALEHVTEAAELNRKLAPSFLSSGGIGPDARRALQSGVSEVREFFGMDTSEAKQLLTDFDRFNKLTSDLIVESIGRAAGGGLGAATNQRLQLLSDSMAGIGSQPGANDLIFADMLESLSDTAKIEGFGIEADRYLEFAKQLRGRRDLGGGVTLEFLE